MNFLRLLTHYLYWHYVLSWVDFWRNSGNLLWFLYNFFSLGELTRHLFAPWRRLGEGYPTVFDLSAFFTALVVNTIMRIVGFIARTAMIVIGSAVLVLASLVTVLAALVWLILPLIIIGLWLLGLKLFFLK